MACVPLFSKKLAGRAASCVKSRDCVAWAEAEVGRRAVHCIQTASVQGATGEQSQGKKTFGHVTMPKMVYIAAEPMHLFGCSA